MTGYQDFVDEAPLDLVYVADHRRMALVPVAQCESFASAAACAIAQNVYLFAASNGLATVIRAWIDRDAIAEALGLAHEQQVLLSQTVGYPIAVPARVCETTSARLSDTVAWPSRRREMPFGRDSARVAKGHSE